MAYPWENETNANPYSIKYEYVGVQEIHVSYDGYDDRPTQSDATVSVSTVSELHTELGSLSSGEMIWVEDGDYNVDNELYREDLPANATLAGDGARLYSPNGVNGMFELSNDGARITGLRLEGNQETGSHSHQSIAILPRANVQIDNCEIYDWMTTGMYVGWASSGQTEITPHIRHNIIRDCRTDGYGYGVATYFNADPLIEYNYINNCREGLASNGNEYASYRAYNNLHGPDAMIFAFECHDPGGVRMDIRNNEIHLVERNDGTMIGRSYAQRGTPTNVADLQYNWFFNPNPPDPNDPGAAGTAISQTGHGSSEYVNVTFSNNHYGSDEPADSSIGIEPLSGEDGSSTIESEIHTNTNDYRTNNGHTSLDLSERISEVARAHSKDMNERDYFDHVNPEGQDGWDRLIEADIEVNSFAENIASQTPASYDPANAAQYAQDIVDGWINSSGHEENIVGSYEREGVGVDVQDGRIRATQVFHSGPDPDTDTTVDISAGVGEIQSALDNTSPEGTVYVEGSGDYEWTESLEVPNGVTLDVSNDIYITVPSNHNITAYSPNGATVYSLITNADRNSANDVTIRGGEYDLSNMLESAEYAGIWLHNASNSEIDDVICRGSGQPVYGSSTNRGFNLALTRCDNSTIRGSEGYDAAYDDIAVRGGCTDCLVVDSGGSGASSGTIQTARWGAWGLTDYPTRTTFERCWGHRIYGHDDIDTEWVDCESDFRLQTIGTDNGVMRDSTNFEGYCLLYTYSSSSSETEVRNMDFAMNGSEDYAIRAGPNGYDHGPITIDGVSGERPELFRQGSYSGGGEIESITIRNTVLTGDETGPIVSQEAGTTTPSMLRVENCTFNDFDEGITGSYDSVRIHDCEFNNINGDPIAVDSNDVETSGISIDQSTPTELLEVYAEDDTDGARISDATVTVTWKGDPLPNDDPGPWTEQTSPNGVASFEDTPVGYHTIEVTHPDYEDSSYDERYWSGSEVDEEALYLTTENAPRRPIIELTPLEGGDTDRTENVYRGDTTLYRWTTSDDWSRSQTSNITPDNDHRGVRMGWNMDEHPWNTEGVSFWPMDNEDSAQDEIGSVHGTYSTGIETGVPGPNGTNAIRFRSGDYITAEQSTIHDFTGSFTLAALIKPSEITRGTIVRNGYLEGGTIFIETHEDNGISFGYYDSDDSAQWNAPFLQGNITVGEWHCVIGTYNQPESTLRVYVNDEYSDYVTSANRPSRSTTLRFGQRPQNNDRQYLGDMAWVGLLNGYISRNEAASMYDALFNGTITVRGKQ